MAEYLKPSDDLVKEAHEDQKKHRDAWKGWGILKCCGDGEKMEELNGEQVEIGDKMYPADRPDLWGQAVRERSLQIGLSGINDAARLRNGPENMQAVMTMVAMGPNATTQQVQDGFRSIENSRKLLETSYEGIRLKEQFEEGRETLKRLFSDDPKILAQKLEELEASQQRMIAVRADFDAVHSAKHSSPFASKNFPLAVDTLINYGKENPAHPIGHGYVYLHPKGKAPHFRKMDYDDVKDHYAANPTEVIRQSLETQQMKEGEAFHPLPISHFIGLLMADAATNATRIAHIMRACGKTDEQIREFIVGKKVGDHLPTWDSDCDDVEMSDSGSKKVESHMEEASASVEKMTEKLMKAQGDEKKVEGVFDESWTSIKSAMNSINPWGSDEKPDIVSTSASELSADELAAILSGDDKVSTLFIAGYSPDGQHMKRIPTHKIATAKMGKDDNAFKAATADVDEKVKKFIGAALNVDASTSRLHNDGMTHCYTPESNGFVYEMDGSKMKGYLMDSSGKIAKRYDVEGFTHKVKIADGSSKPILGKVQEGRTAAVFSVMKLKPEGGGPSTTVMVQSRAPGLNGDVYAHSKHVEAVMSAEIPTKNGAKIGAAMHVDVVNKTTKNRASVTLIKMKN